MSRWSFMLNRAVRAFITAMYWQGWSDTPFTTHLCLIPFFMLNRMKYLGERTLLAAECIRVFTAM